MVLGQAHGACCLWALPHGRLRPGRTGAALSPGGQPESPEGLFTAEVVGATPPAVPVVHPPGTRMVPAAEAGKPRLREVRPPPVLHRQEEVAVGPLASPASTCRA